jgi:hypothetical protein
LQVGHAAIVSPHLPRLSAWVKIKNRKELDMTIHFNGKTYQHLDEMPANERMAYEQMMNIFVDKNGNGIPDFLEGDMVQNVMSAYSTRVDFNGSAIHSLEDLPPEARQQVADAFQMLSKLGILPDVSSQMPVSREPQVTSKPFISREYDPTIQEEKSNTMLVVALVGLVTLLCLGGAAVAAFLLLG